MVQIYVYSPEDIIKSIFRRQNEPKKTLSQKGLEHGMRAADGKTLVIYSPRAKDADSHGLLYEPICLATRRGKDMRIITNTDIGLAYRIEGDTAFWIGGLSKIDRAIEAAEGTEFRGWKNTKQYRYTASEISDATKGKVFKFALDF